ncbi:hypothetical protein EGI22_22405 [Lacihabitans sp. LS3-19]|uniref:WbqC family protein n=1 Tax=Lacihabitans sp. LS3-19 TaxID=2487335 RepID=UPI0020CE0FD9|nr:WbqC family protein [Lacihabitans sp. LS3-19]MCP9770668.1 hypothetical protein [Lacihabitans sp. LS3-19]
MKKIAIMQPYFLPYIGYFQLINAVDEFVIYDNIQFSKKGWFHRNRILQNGKDEYITLPLKKDSDYLDVNQRFLSDTWETEREKLFRKIKENYRKAPFFENTIDFLEKILFFEDKNLFTFLANSLTLTCNYLEIRTPIITSSTLQIEHSLKSQDKVLAICKEIKATKYINPIGGLELYQSSDFQIQNIELSFIKSKPIEYLQFGKEFVPWLSILDLLMFNDITNIQKWLGEFEEIRI